MKQREVRRIQDLKVRLKKRVGQGWGKMVNIKILKEAET